MTRMVSFQLTEPAYLVGDGLLPADLDGDRLPPDDAPAYLVGSMDAVQQHAAPPSPGNRRGPRPMSPGRTPRYRLTVYELRDGKTPQVIDAYGNGFITALATLTATSWTSTSTRGPRDLQRHIAAAIADEYGTGRRR